MIFQRLNSLAGKHIFSITVYGEQNKDKVFKKKESVNRIWRLTTGENLTALKMFSILTMEKIVK